MAAALAQSGQAPENIASPAISGDPTVGATLSVSDGAWSGDTPTGYGYQWQDCDPSGQDCWDIAGATGDTYQVPSWQQGELVGVTVTASSPDGDGAAPAAPVGPVAQAETPAAPVYFPSSFWSTPIAAGAALDPQSSEMARQLADMAFGVAPSETYDCRQATYLAPVYFDSDQQMYCHQVTARAGVSTSIDTPTVYTVGAGQPTVPVTLPSNPSLQAAMQAVPIPAGALPSPGSDGQMIIWQPSSDTMWELWRARQDAAGQWLATWGGRITDVSTDPGHYRNIPNADRLCSAAPKVRFCEQANWGGAAARVPILPGLITLDQLQSGAIDHALALALPMSLQNAWTWPAQHSDGPGDSVIPEGARIRIDPSLNLDAWFAHLSGPTGAAREIAPIEYMIARAMQTYGAVVVNTSGAVSFYAQNWLGTGGDPFTAPGGYFGGLSPATFMEDLPWEQTQVLQTHMCNVPAAGSGLYETACSPPAYVTPDPDTSHRCGLLRVSPQYGQTSGPQITISSPTWPNIGHRTRFSAFVTDPSGVTEVAFEIDGVVRFVSTYPDCGLHSLMQYQMGGPEGFWDAWSEVPGPHTLTVTAIDSLGNTSSVSEQVSTARG